jgi:serine/threonine protein kinase
MERLTFSPYVINVYGYCGQSAINELADYDIEGMTNLEKVSRSFRGMMDIEPVSVIRLRLAYMVAAGVSHIHSIDYPDVPPIPVTVEDDGKAESFKSAVKAGTRVKSNATLVHYDLNPRNVAVVKRGIPKLNDFNVAEFMTWDAKPDRPCGFRGRFREPWWRSPEEMHYHLPNYTNPVPLTEKVDIYSLGNILWTILTTHSPWKMVKGEAEERTRPKVARGVLPNWPDDFDHTKLESDPALMAINLAMRRCLRFNPEERPTAGEIAAELNDAIENLPVGFGDKEKWKNEMMTRANTTNQTG